MSSIEEPPKDFDGKVNAEDFWERVSLEMISRGLVPSEYNSLIQLVSHISVCFLYYGIMIKYSINNFLFKDNKQTPLWFVRATITGLHGLVLTQEAGIIFSIQNIRRCILLIV